MVTVIVLQYATYVTAAILVALSFNLHSHQTSQGKRPLWGGPAGNAALNLNAGATTPFVWTQMFSRNRRGVGAGYPAARENSEVYRLSGEGSWSFTSLATNMSDGQLIPATTRSQLAGYRGVSQSRLKLLSQIPPMANRPWRRDAGG